MARIYEETHTIRWHTHVPLDVVWDYIFDRDAQERYDPRIRAIRMVSGEWGSVGSVMTMTGVDAHGVEHTLNMNLESVDRPRSYSTREGNEDAVVVTTISTSRDDDAGATVVTAVTSVRTRPLTLLERFVVRRTRAERAAEAERAATAVREALSEYYASRA